MARSNLELAEMSPKLSARKSAFNALCNALVDSGHLSSFSQGDFGSNVEVQFEFHQDAHIDVARTHALGELAKRGFRAAPTTGRNTFVVELVPPAPYTQFAARLFCWELLKSAVGIALCAIVCYSAVQRLLR